MRKIAVLALASILCGPLYGQMKTTVSSSGGVSGNSSGYSRGSSNTSVRTSAAGDRWVISGNLGLGFTDHAMNISLSPQIGYAITRYFTAGAGVMYNFYNNYDSAFKRHAVGANVYARLYILRYITLHVQPEITRWWWRPKATAPAPVTTTSILGGAGVTLPLGAGSYISLMLWYDLLQSANSPYGKEISYSVGYGFRF